MKEQTFLKKFPKSEKRVLTFFKNNVEQYAITRTHQDRYKLYSYDNATKTYTFLKSKNDPLFPEVYSNKRSKNI